MARRLSLVFAALLTLASVAPAAAQKSKVTDLDPDFDQDRPPAGLIVGRVVDAATNQPIAQAMVTLLAPRVDPPPVGAPLPPPASAPAIFTDASGRFLFRNVAAGTFHLTATASGYLDGAFGQARPAGAMRPFAIAQDQRVGDLTIRLWKEATIAGRVLDETGAPLVQVWVAVEPRAPTSPRSRFARTIARTDDQGAFRVGGLSPGEYLVAVPSRMAAWPAAIVTADDATLQAVLATGASVGRASPVVRLGDLIVPATSELAGLTGRLPTAIRADGRVVAYPTTFYPSATAAAGAEPIALKSGDARSGVDITLRPVAMGRVSGTVVGPNGPEPNFAVHIVPAFAASDALELSFETSVTITDAKGAFSFPAVPPGAFVVKAWRRPQVLVIGRDAMPPDTTLWAEMPVTVGEGGLSNVQVALRPGAIVSGRLRFEGTIAAPPAVQPQTTLSVAFEPASWPGAFGARLAVRVSETLEFITQGLPPGRYVPLLPNQFTASLRGWYFESATHNGRDLMIDPLTLDASAVRDVVITFGDRRSELSGTVTDAAGRPDANAAVVVFPADYRAWIQNGLAPIAGYADLASQAGTFSLTVRPGEYFVAAVSEEQLAAWPNAATVQAVAAAATRVTILRGESKRQDLRRGGR